MKNSMNKRVSGPLTAEFLIAWSGFGGFGLQQHLWQQYGPPIPDKNLHATHLSTMTIATMMSPATSHWATNLTSKHLANLIESVIDFGITSASTVTNVIDHIR